MERRCGLARAPPLSVAAPPLPLSLSQWEVSILQGVTGQTPRWSCKSAKAAGSSYSAEGDASPARGREAAGCAVRERGRRAAAAEGRPGVGPARGGRAAVTSGGAARASLLAGSPQAQPRPGLPAPARPSPPSTPRRGCSFSRAQTCLASWALGARSQGRGPRANKDRRGPSGIVKFTFGGGGDTE